LREVESGVSVAEVCRKHGVSEWSVYRWRTKYRGMDVSEARRLRTLEDENARLKRIVAQQAMDIDALKEVLSKKW
jgi:putative transposase